MNQFQREIYKTIDILTEEKMKQLGFDKTMRGVVESVGIDTCVVDINGDSYSCRLRRGIFIEHGDIVFVRFPQNSTVDKYVDTVLGSNAVPEYLVISAQEVLTKLKTVDGDGSGLDADMLGGKHSSQYATKEDISEIDIDGEVVVGNINASQSIIEDKNLSADVNDSILKKHEHINKSALDNIDQGSLDAWSSAVNHVQDTIRHVSQEDKDKWDTVTSKSDKAYVDAKLLDKVDKVAGKQLSTEDYTEAEKVKLAGVEVGANKYIHPAGTNPHGTTKADIGLGSVENKSSSTIRSEITEANVISSLGYTPEDNSYKGAANGYASLDGNAKIPLAALPDIAKQQTYVLSSIAERNVLSGLITGEKCYIITSGDSYIWDGSKWVTLAKSDWENVNLQWTNIIGKPASNVADIDDAASKRHAHTNKSILDSVTQALIDRWNDSWAHISDAVRHITSAERTKWNAVEQKVDKVEGKQLSTEDYTTAEKIKLTNIEAEANKYIHPVTHSLDEITETTTKKIMTNTERTKLSGIEAGAQVNTVTSVANMVGAVMLAKGDVGLGNVDNKSSATIRGEITNANVVNSLGYVPLKEVPIASEMLLGGIKVGANLSITESGVLSALDSDGRSTFIVKQEVFVASEGQSVFNLAEGEYQPNTNTLSVFIYGGKQPNTILNELSSSSFSIEGLQVGDILIVEYFELSSATPYPIHGVDHITGGYDPIPQATVSNDGLMTKEDKSKLAGVEVGANKYTHPSAHPASMIVETSSMRFVSDTEKTAWNNKVDTTYLGTELNKKVDKVAGKQLSAEDYTTTEKSKLAGIEVGANKYTHPTNHPPSIITQDVNNRFVTDAEKSTWNNKAEITDIPTKVSQLANDSGYLNTLPVHNHDALYEPKNTNIQAHISNKLNPHGVTKAQIGLGSVNNTADIDKPISTAMQTALNGKVDNPRVLTDVPAGAVFTDTVYTHPTTAGNKHIPTGGTVGQVLKNTASGTATWQNETDTVTTINGKTGAITKADIVELGIPAQDTVYTHPSSHPASIVTQDANNRFVTDAEKSTWNAKQNTLSGDIVEHYHSEDRKWANITEKPSVFTPSAHDHDTSYVKKTGDTITGGDLYVDGGSVNYIRPVTTGGWARGFWWSQRDKTRIGGIGVLGSGDSVSKFYIGYGLSPWTGSILEAFPSYVNVGGDLRKQGKSVATTEDLNAKVKTDVPLGAEFTDTKYTHPSTHPASMITEDTTKRFVSDSEKATWNAKAPTASPSFTGTPTAPTASAGTSTSQIATTSFVQSALSAGGYGDMLKSQFATNAKASSGYVDKSILADGATNADTVNGFTVGKSVPSNAVFTDTIYTHPISHPASMITQDANNSFVTDAEKTIWSNKQNSLGTGTTSQFLRGDNTWQAVTKANVGLGSVLNYGVATQAEAEAGTSNVKYMTPLRVKQAIDKSSPIHVGTTAPANSNMLWIDTSL